MSDNLLFDNLLKLPKEIRYEIYNKLTFSDLYFTLQNNSDGFKRDIDYYFEKSNFEQIICNLDYSLLTGVIFKFDFKTSFFNLMTCIEPTNININENLIINQRNYQLIVKPFEYVPILLKTIINHNKNSGKTFKYIPIISKKIMINKIVIEDGKLMQVFTFLSSKIYTHVWQIANKNLDVEISDQIEKNYLNNLNHFNLKINNRNKCFDLINMNVTELDVNLPLTRYPNNFKKMISYWK